VVGRKPESNRMGRNAIQGDGVVIVMHVMQSVVRRDAGERDSADSARG